MKDLSIAEKKKIISTLTDIIVGSQNFAGLDGKTQTNTNRLDAEGLNGEKRTTRGIHSDMVSELAGILIDGASSVESNASSQTKQGKLSEEEWEYEAMLAQLIGLCHDMGHCSYGHDGEEAYRDFMQAQGKKGETAKKFRDKYYRDYESQQQKQNEAVEDYESQQQKQNEVVGDNSTREGYTFDHGEQSAEAFINLCEANGISADNPVVQEVVQGILFHSRPAFSSSSLACQAVAISDTMSFYQDDSAQMVAFLKISGEKAKLKAKTGGLIDDDFLEMRTKERKDAATAEVIANYRETGKLQSGQHFEDQKWYISKVIKRVPDLVEDFKKLQKVITTLGSFGIKISLEGVDREKPDPTVVTERLVAARDAIEVEFQTKFPFNYKCMTFHKYVANSLIVNGKIGNNRTEDMTYTKAMMAGFTKDISDARKEHSAEFLDTPRPFKETMQVLFKTKTFQTIKAQIQQAVVLHNAKSTNAPSFRGMKVLSGITKPEEITNEVVLQCLGINLPEKYWESSTATAGILDSCTPMQIMTKILSGMTNSMHRFVTREVVKNLDASFLQQGQQGKNGYPVIPSFSEKELVYLGKKPMVKGDDGSFHEAEVSEETIKQVLKDELRQGFSLRLEIPDFRYEKILRHVGVTYAQISKARSSIIEEITGRLDGIEKKITEADAKTEKAGDKIETETDFDTKLKEVTKLEEEIKEIEQAFEGDETIIQAIAYFNVRFREKMDKTSYQVKKPQGEKSDPDIDAATIDIDQQIINLKNALKNMKNAETGLYGMIEKIEKLETLLKSLSNSRKAVVSKITEDELNKAIEEINKESKGAPTKEESDLLQRYEQLRKERKNLEEQSNKAQTEQNEQEQQRSKDLS